MKHIIAEFSSRQTPRKNYGDLSLKWYVLVIQKLFKKYKENIVILQSISYKMLIKVIYTSRYSSGAFNPYNSFMLG